MCENSPSGNASELSQFPSLPNTQLKAEIIDFLVRKKQALSIDIESSLALSHKQPSQKIVNKTLNSMQKEGILEVKNNLYQISEFWFDRIESLYLKLVRVFR